MRRKNAWTTYNKKQLDELEKLCKNYLKFLDKGKTERECVKQIVKQAEEKGYVNLAKQWDAVIPYIEEHRMSDWVHRKTIQKAVESYRITDEQKRYLKGYR